MILLSIDSEETIISNRSSVHGRQLLILQCSAEPKILKENRTILKTGEVEVDFSTLLEKFKYTSIFNQIIFRVAN